ncbi:serine/threonine-protein kinase Nek4-like [Corticium candelabrum]|uniref:serine/threonine-protein kinase Nek4-like n=1 Tax=Corticium candelabrum TaxID=121492 RepID=UPI002E27142B|nr:serine/threonine-protein kinase Nek4-like [Corticium candelabrum]
MERYVVERQIGKGGSCAVFLVRHTVEDRLYALKQTYVDHTKKSRTREAVLREVQILSKLKHPHVVSYKESFFNEKEQHLNIVQDYCDSGTLYSQISEAREDRKPFSEARIMKWFVQVTMALQHIHSQKVLHRDLKPQNIFLTKGDVIKVGDFGISKLLDNTLDMANTCVGTPYYLSPELCQDAPYNSKSDMWALGCLLYELCELRPPFNASSLIGLIYAIVKGSYNPLSGCYSELIHFLVRQLLSKSPTDRPSAAAILNMDEVRHHLSVIAEQQQRPRSTCEHRRQRTSSCGLITHPDTARAKSDSELTVASVASEMSSNTVASLRKGASVVAYTNHADEETGHYSDDFDESSASSSASQKGECIDNEQYQNGGTNIAQSESNFVGVVPVVGEYNGDSVQSAQCVSRSLSPSSSCCSPDLSVPCGHGSKCEDSLETAPEVSKLDGGYAEDFEDSGSDESDLEATAAAAAKDALGVTAEEHFVADDQANVSYQQALRKHCNSVLGDAVFQQVLDCFANSMSGDEETIRSRVQMLAGPELTETCFFVHELLQIDENL